MQPVRSIFSGGQSHSRHSGPVEPNIHPEYKRVTFLGRIFKDIPYRLVGLGWYDDAFGSCQPQMNHTPNDFATSFGTVVLIEIKASCGLGSSCCPVDLKKKSKQMRTATHSRDRECALGLNTKSFCAKIARGTNQIKHIGWEFCIPFKMRLDGPSLGMSYHTMLATEIRRWKNTLDVPWNLWKW